MSAMATGVTLVCDTRERGLIQELTKRGIQHTVAALDVGDFMFQTADGTPLLVAERKSHADFAASNSDGRYREQRARLMAVRGSGVAVLYVLEGTWSPNGTLVYCAGRTTEELLQRLTTRLILRYGMPVLASASIAETARWCQVIAAQLVADSSVFQPEEGLATATTAAMSSFTAALNTVKKGNKTPVGTAQAMLSAVPGLGEKRVAALLATKSIAELAVTSEAELAALVVGGKKLGPAVAATIVGALTARG
jgi:ERCC4-type nuclease